MNSTGRPSRPPRLFLAARLAYSESAFLRPRTEEGHYDVRYFSPEAEVPFCGRATIASGVALAEHAGATGRLVLHTASGEVPVDTETDAEGRTVATLTSVVPYVEEAAPALVFRALELLRWDPGDLDPELPPRVAYAGARHLILPCRARERLAELDYAFGALKALMLDHDLVTVDLVWREDGPPSMRATRSRSAGLSRTPRPARRPRRSAPTCASWAPSRRRWT